MSQARKHPQTPVLARALDAVRGRLVRAVVFHAVGSVAFALCAWIAFAFVADRVLGVPHAVRWLHLLVLFALPAFVLWREGLRHLKRIPDRAGLAVLAERGVKGSEELFVSAIQLRGRDRSDSGEPLEDSLVDAVLARAEERAQDFSIAPVLDLRGPNRRAALGLGAVAATGLWLALLPAGYAAIFAGRLFGGSTPWPQRTFLELELPVTGGSATVETEGEVLRARVARGSDLPILVRARGVMPETVRLELEDGREIELGGGRGGLFRTELPAVSENLAFAVYGGDDVDGLPRAEIEVLQPPDVTGVAILVTPPDYAGLEPELFLDRGARALRGSTIDVVIRTTEGVVEASADLLPAGRRMPLTERAFPSLDGTDAGRGQGCSFVAENDARLRFQLLDSNGLANPDPGLFSVDVVDDRSPEIAVVAPGRTNVESVAGGALALRASIEDDFGLTSVRLRVRATDDEERVFEQELETVPLGLTGDSGTSAIRLHRLLEIDELVAELESRGAVDVDSLTLELEAFDTAQPAQRGAAAPIRVRLLTFDTLLRRVQDRLGKARVEAGALAELQRERRERTTDLVASLTDDGPLEDADSRAVQTVLNGQRRVQGDAEELLRELAATASLVLYARLDKQGEPLLRALDEALSTRVGRSFEVDPWRTVVAARDQLSGTDEGFAPHLVEIVGLGLDVLDRSADGTRSLTRAEGSGDLAAMRGELDQSLRAQGETLERIEDLLDRLAEWDNFQSVLALTRDILERQKAVRERVERLAQEDK